MWKGVSDTSGCNLQIPVVLPSSLCGDTKITGNEQCDPPSDCCNSQCNFKNSDVQCRASASQCGIQKEKKKEEIK